MFKKLICMLMTMVLLVAMVVPAAAAEETSSRPTVEEILNGYHEKAFAQQTSGATESPAAYSRSGGSQKTLEQETVEELTAAGYEAYNVTAENYDTLEESLKSDFASMGLSRDGSYIIVIGGDEPEETASPRSIIGGGPAYDHIGDDGGATTPYTYEGTTYYLRYLTVTAATGAYMSVDSTYTLQPSDVYEELGMNVLETFLISQADDVGASLFKGTPIGTIVSLIYDMAADDNFTVLESNTLTIHANTLWTCKVIEVYNERFDRWDTAQASAYATSKARCVGYLYNTSINESVWFDGVEHSVTTYSPKYSNLAQRKLNAVEAFLDGQVSHDRTGDINFYLGDETGEVLYGESGEPLFTHCEHWQLP